MSKQRPPSNLAGCLWLALWTVLTVPFIGRWSFALPVGLFLWAAWKMNLQEREEMRQAAEERQAEALAQSRR